MPPSLEILSQLKTPLKIVAALSDGAVVVPGLRAAASISIEIIEIVETIKRNQEDAIEVAKSVAERTSSLLDAFKGRTKDEIPPDLQADIQRYGKKLELVQEILRKYTTQKGVKGISKRIFSRVEDKGEIIRCKEILAESFQVFEIALTLRLHTRLPDVLAQIQSFIAAGKPALSKLRIIPREELDLREHWRLDANIKVVLAVYKGERVAVRKYGTDKQKWAADIETWLEPDAWQPHRLQVIGQSEANACGLHLVFKDPGVPVQMYVQHECLRSVKKCTLDVLTMVNQFASAANELLSENRGGCKIDTAQVCLRLPPNNKLDAPNFILADFDSSHLYQPSASADRIASDGWDTFVNIITKSIFGSFSKPNYAVGNHGDTGPRVTQTFRFFIHFLHDFRYHKNRLHDSLDHIFKKLASEIMTLQADIEMSDSHGRNPLLYSMQRTHSAELCAIWDVWHTISVAPGDIGVMIPGDDVRYPQFRRIVNIATDIKDWLYEQGQVLPEVTTRPAKYAEQLYIPSDSSYWSAETVGNSMIRHTLRIGSAPSDTFAFYRDHTLSFLGASFDYNASWSYLRYLQETGKLLALAEEHSILPEDLMLVFSSSQSKGYTRLNLRTAQGRDVLLAKTGANDGSLYYFENLAAVEGEIVGYWSASDQPGHPLWGGWGNAPGPEWAWEHIDGDFKVETGRKGPVQHIRYLQL